MTPLDILPEFISCLLGIGIGALLTWENMKPVIESQEAQIRVMSNLIRNLTDHIKNNGEPEK
ncbi:hypothetical protein [Methanorbis furvi]|uniref:Uncharacterized protein n=1 Tax=Methanorbis furvi TaxID=3028299 RepID=A0AAE4MF92_9EURY|nr:hypothetical protein [Methanocorpusculaceae archaeon Ag1]